MGMLLRMGEAFAGFDTFIGRTYELGVARQCRAAARRGTGRLLLVTGEGGIGKTRFCREVAAEARDDGLLVASSGCWSDGGAPPLWPWPQILADLGDDTAGTLFACDSGGTAVDPERFARFAAITGRLAGVCARSPALVVIDDMHAADAGAALLARFVTRALDHLPLVLVLARRIGAESAVPEQSLDNAATMVTLGRFTLADTAAFLRAHGQRHADADLLAALQRLTGGHPLHLKRVVSAGRAGTAGPSPAIAAVPHMPATVRAAIADAVDQLDAPAGRLLGAAALLGSRINLSEVATVGRVARSTVDAAVCRAVPAGLVTRDDPEHFSFSHDLVREVLAEALSAGERVEIHARAADLLTRRAPATPDRLTRGAYHAVQAAHASPYRAGRAIGACRAAARIAIERFGYEQAVSLLADAAATHERAGLTDQVAVIIVEWAEALLLCGRLAEAREIFDRAASAAASDGDPVLLARAALGLGGVWVNEHRTRLEWERVVGLQRRALAGLPPGEEGLRQRLTVRLAAEEVYRGGPIEPVLAALDEARRLGDAQVLAEALSLCHHALLTPRHTHRRLVLADELIRVASAAGAGVLALVGLCWRTVDLFHLGDSNATTALAELRERAEAVGCLSALYVAEAMEVMLLIRAGRLDEAEAKAHCTYELGMKVGDADALGYLGVHLTTIRWLQGRGAEMLGTIERVAGSPTLNPAEFGFQATVAYLAAEAGHHDTARTVLDRLTSPGLAALPESSTWLAALLAIVESARLLGDARLARQAYELLCPYGDQPIMPSLAVTCFGSAQRALGLAALAFGDRDRAAEHLARAVRANRLLGHRPATAIARADLAEALARRGTGTDRAQAVQLLIEARAEADAMGMRRWSEAWSGRLADLAGRDATIAQEGRHWVLAARGQQAIVPDRIGLRYLAQLLTSPAQPVTALRLTTGDAVSGAAAVTTGQPTLDRRAHAAYRRRVSELTDQVGQATARGDRAAVERARGELDFLLDELRRTTGLGGRPRSFPDQTERARTAVQKAIKRAIAEVEAVEPAIGKLLATTVVTGATCCYRPDPEQPVHWRYIDDR